jgi:mono/diheme cytochrome c family protein
MTLVALRRISLVLGTAATTLLMGVGLKTDSSAARSFDLHGGAWSVVGDDVLRSIGERRQTFLGNRAGVRAVLPIASDAAFVLLPPDLLFVRDTDRDGAADESTTVASGLAQGTDIAIASEGWMLIAGTRSRFHWDGARLERGPNLDASFPQAAPVSSGGFVTLDRGEIVFWPGDPIRLPDGRLIDSPPRVLGATLERDAVAAIGVASASGELSEISLASPPGSLIRDRWRWNLRPDNSASQKPSLNEPTGSRDLVAFLASPDPSQRLAALEEILYRAHLERSEAAVGEAIRSLTRDHVDATVRRLGLCGLERLGALTNTDRAMAASDSSALVRRFAASIDNNSVAASLADPRQVMTSTLALRAGLAAALSGSDADMERVIAAAAGFESQVIDWLIGGGERDKRDWRREDAIDRAIASILARGEPAGIRSLFERSAARLAAGDLDRATRLAQAAFSVARPLARRHTMVRLDRAPDGYGDLLASEVAAPYRKVDAWIRWPGRSDVEAPSLATTIEETIELGRQVYGTCMTCHGPAGRGQEGVYPPLASSPYVNGDPERLAKILLHGLKGRVVVGTREVVGLMPRPPVETDEEIAAVMTYVRQAFGNASPPVDTGLVRTVRERHATRTEPWDVSELDSEGASK